MTDIPFTFKYDMCIKAKESYELVQLWEKFARLHEKYKNYEPPDPIAFDPKDPEGHNVPKVDEEEFQRYNDLKEKFSDYATAPKPMHVELCFGQEFKLKGSVKKVSSIGVIIIEEEKGEEIATDFADIIFVTLIEAQQTIFQ